MADFTPNYNLKKPLRTEYYNVADANGNSDIVDTQLKAVNDRVGLVEGEVDALELGKVDKVVGQGLSDENYTLIEKNKLAGIEENATADMTALEIKTEYESNADTNAYTDAEKAKVANLPADTNAQLDGKVDKVAGKGLSTNDFDNTYKQKIDTDIPAQLAETDQRIDNIITTPVPVGSVIAEEIIDARQDGISLGDNLTKIKTDLSKKANEMPIVVFTFDDGTSYDETTYALMKSKGLVSCFGLITEQLYGGGKTSLNKYSQYEKEGFEVLSHSSIHLNMVFDTYSEQLVDFEYKQSAERLRGLGFNANGLIIPFSGAKPSDYEVARKHYDYILEGSLTGLNGKSDFKSKILGRASAYTLGVAGVTAKIDEAIADKKLLIFYDHGVGNTGSLTQAEWETIADYVKTKVDAGLLVNCNMSDAIQRFYGTNLTTKVKPKNTLNYAIPFSDPSWVLTDVNAIGVNSTVLKTSRTLLIPATVADKNIILSHTFRLPNTFVNLGECIDIEFDIVGSNSQAVSFSNSLEVNLLSASDVVLATQIVDASLIFSTKIYPRKIKTKIYCNSGTDISTVAKVEIKLKVSTTASTTVQQSITVSDLKILFLNSTYKNIKDGVMLAPGSNQTIPTSVSTKINLSRVSFNDNNYFNIDTQRYVPPTGKYMFNMEGMFNTGVINTDVRFELWKNGAMIQRTHATFTGTGKQAIPSLTRLDVANGTDYYEFYVYQATGGDLILLSQPNFAITILEI